MLTMAKNPSLKWLMVSNRRVSGGNVHTVWRSVGKDEIVMHRSWNSIRLIIEWMKKNRQKERPVLFVPEYYCYDTILQINKVVKVVYYPITISLAPDIAECRKLAKQIKPDLFLFVHYWGHIFNGNDVSVFCRQYDAVLIEDAAHVLIPDKRVGKQSDFILFSPWKLLGIPDGAVLVIGNKNRYQITGRDLEELLVELQMGHVVPGIDIFQWKCKRILLKVLPNFQRMSFNTISVCNKEPIREVSPYSRRILTQITREELLELGERRKENNLYIVEYCKRKYKGFSLFSENIGVPYMTPVCVSNEAAKEALLGSFQRVGRIVTKWPCLAPDIPEKSLARQLEKDVLAIAVHDNLSPDILVKRLRDSDMETGSHIVLNRTDREQYDFFCNKGKDILPLLQSSVYGEVKADVQNWRPEYYLFYKNNRCIACFMVLCKKKIVSVFRINQGIVWLEEPDRETRYEAYRLLAKRFSGYGKILFLACREQRNGDNLAFMARNGLRYRKIYASTGYLNLCKTTDELRKNLDSKWRNQLKSAEAKELVVHASAESEELRKLLGLHIQHKKEANYEDSGDKVTCGLIERQALKAYLVKNECDKVLAFIMIALHGGSATYYIGWSSEEGYKLNLNKLLLWNAIMDLKKNGFRWLDLGGIDFIYTPGIAEFKMGTGCEYYEMVGEFMKIRVKEGSQN